MKEQLRILIVEDREDDALLFVRELQKGDYEVMFRRVETKESLTESLEQEDWDIILSDYDLPDMNGYDALQILQNKQIDLPFIVISGKIGEDVAVTMMRAGAHDYLLKGHLSRLGPAVKRELEEARARQKQRQTEKALQESEDQFRTLVDNIPGAMYRCAFDDHRTIYLVTRPIQDICGYPAANLINNRVRSFASIIHPDDREMVDQAIQWAVSQKESFMMEYRIIHADENVRWIYEKGRGIFDNNGNLQFLDGAVFDITKDKLVEEATAKAATLEELDQLRSALLASVSHELRTPLTSIKGLASTLIQPDIQWDKETQIDFLQTINRETDRLTHIVSDLVDMSQLEAGIMRMTPKDISIHSLFNQLHDELQVQSANHQLEINLSDDLPHIYADEIRIGEVLTNLVANASAYSEEGTGIRVEARQANGEILINVNDQGSGIATEHLEKVFDRFYRLEEGVQRRRGGTGLGLSICKGIVEAHNGRIWAESEPGKGSNFIFSLPTGEKSTDIDS